MDIDLGVQNLVSLRLEDSPERSSAIRDGMFNSEVARAVERRGVGIGVEASDIISADSERKEK